MRVAHIIMAHKNPSQLLRLAKTLNHPQFDIYVHIDAKVAIEDFKVLNSIPNLSFIKERSECNWGGFSLFKGIINCLKQVLASGVEYDFVNLISGQDYPIVSAEAMYSYLEKRKGSIFISFEESSESEWWKNAAPRYEQYHLTDFNIKGRYLLQNLINKLAPTRKFPDNLKLYGGNKACWWTLTKESALYVINKLEEAPKLYRFLKFCWGTDEFVIPTLIMNSPLKDKVVNDNLRYIDWSEGNPHPKLLELADFNNIASSNMLFARKFDYDLDVAIFDKLDEESH
jgi:hypothetical protein